MSQLAQLKQSVTAVAQSSRGSAGELQRFIQEFNKQITEVQSLIGGSAQRADQQVIQALQGASSSVQQSIGALSAARVAAEYANGL